MTGSFKLCGAYLILSIASVLIADVNTATYTVGDDIGSWTIPATTNDLNYTAWSDARNFRFEDELVFRYANSNHNVLMVNQSDYETCFLEDPITTFSSGDDTIALNLPGVRDYYFICGMPSHCVLGQKLHVTLVGSVPESPDISQDAQTPPSKSDASPSSSLSMLVKSVVIISAFLMSMVSFSCTHLI